MKNHYIKVLTIKKPAKNAGKSQWLMKNLICMKKL